MKVTCPNCGAIGRASRIGAQEAIRCPRCMAILRVDDAESRRGLQTIDKRGQPIDLPAVHRENVEVEEGDSDDSADALDELVAPGSTRSPADRPAEPVPLAPAHERPDASPPYADPKPAARQKPSPEQAAALDAVLSSTPAGTLPGGVRKPPSPRLEDTVDLDAALEGSAPAQRPGSDSRKAPVRRDPMLRSHDELERRRGSLLRSKALWACGVLLLVGIAISAALRQPSNGSTEDAAIRQQAKLFLEQYCTTDPTDTYDHMMAQRFDATVDAQHMSGFLEWFRDNWPGELMGTDAKCTYAFEIRKVEVIPQADRAKVGVLLVKEWPDGKRPRVTASLTQGWQRDSDGNWHFSPDWTQRLAR